MIFIPYASYYLVNLYFKSYNNKNFPLAPEDFFMKALQTELLSFSKSMHIFHHLDVCWVFILFYLQVSHIIHQKFKLFEAC